jgi:hypothetical protein
MMFGVLPGLRGNSSATMSSKSLMPVVLLWVLSCHSSRIVSHLPSCTALAAICFTDVVGLFGTTTVCGNSSIVIAGAESNTAESGARAGPASSTRPAMMVGTSGTLGALPWLPG